MIAANRINRCLELALTPDSDGSFFIRFGRWGRRGLRIADGVSWDSDKKFPMFDQFGRTMV